MLITRFLGNETTSTTPQLQVLPETQGPYGSALSWQRAVVAALHLTGCNFLLSSPHTLLVSGRHSRRCHVKLNRTARQNARVRLWWRLCVRLLGGATARGGPTLLCDEGARDRRGPLAALAPLGDLGLGLG